MMQPEAVKPWGFVAVLVDRPEMGLFAGHVGTVVEVLGWQPALEIWDL